MSKAILVLGRDTGCDMPEDDWNSWVAFVAQHISARSELDVELDERRLDEVQTDVVWVEVESTEVTLRCAVQDLWNEWCAAGAPRA